MRNTIWVLLGFALLSACGESAPVPSIYDQAVASTTRLEGDYARDTNRKPAAVLEFVGIRPGDRVLDMFSGGGYYSELLAIVVGPEGHVLSHSNQAYLGFVGDEFKARHAEGRLPNVEVLMAENNELELEADSLDAIMLVLSFHDLYYADPDRGWPQIDDGAFLAELYKGLRPGGVVGIVDHAAKPGSSRETGGTVHRIDSAIVQREMELAGFVLEATSDILRNPDDDHSRSVFEPEIRGQTDRFVMRWVKPAS